MTTTIEIDLRELLTKKFDELREDNKETNRKLDKITERLDKITEHVTEI